MKTPNMQDTWAAEAKQIRKQLSKSEQQQVRAVQQLRRAVEREERKLAAAIRKLNRVYETTCRAIDRQHDKDIRPVRLQEQALRRRLEQLEQRLNARA